MQDVRESSPVQLSSICRCQNSGGSKEAAEGPHPGRLPSVAPSPPPPH